MASLHMQGNPWFFFPLLVGALCCHAEPSPELKSYLRDKARFTDKEIASIDRGVAIAKLLPTKTPAEVFVVGIVHIQSTPEEYVHLAFNLDRLRKLPGYLDVQKVHQRPQISDFQGFTLEPEDIQALRTCRPGRCDIQLPAEVMEALKNGIDWSQPDVEEQINLRLQKKVLAALTDYQANGNSVLTTYHDKDEPFHIRQQFQDWLERSVGLSDYLPKLSEYLLEYPRVKPPHGESLFYWEKVNFGMKPTIRLNHAITYRADHPETDDRIVVVKQLYASHYFQLALDLSACVPKDPMNPQAGFYLVTLKGSIQQGFTGFRGAFLRQIATSKTRSAQEKGLIGIKTELEKKR